MIYYIFKCIYSILKKEKDDRNKKIIINLTQ
jgi:hypothetical protein